MPDLEKRGVEGQLRTLYVRIDECVFWEDNSHVANVMEIKKAIRADGFRVPCIYDPQLNKGEGAIAAGEHRITALREMYADDEEVPRYIKCDPDIDPDGMWRVPVVFGADSESEAAAEAFAINHNNVGLAALPSEDQFKVWHTEKYLGTLKRLADQGQIPTSVREDQLKKWLAKSEPAPEQETEKINSEQKSKRPKPAVFMMAIVGADITKIEEAYNLTGSNHNRAEATNAIFQFYLDHHQL